MSKNLAVLISGVLLAAPAQAAEIAGRAQVVDGGKLQIGNATVELHGIDAPDLDQFCMVGTRLYRCGQEASWALAERIERHWVTCDEEGAARDAGRVAATCYIGGRNGMTSTRIWCARDGRSPTASAPHVT
jgi:endonuclease YncB( thermonuclease family)